MILPMNGVRHIHPDNITFERYHRYEEHLPISWTSEYDILSNEPTMVPLYLEGYHQSFHEIPPFLICPTNGIASGNSVEVATRHAVSKLIERDDCTMAEIISNRLGVVGYEVLVAGAWMR